MMDGDFSGTVNGTINAVVEAGAVEPDEPETAEPDELPEEEAGKESDDHA